MPTNDDFHAFSPTLDLKPGQPVRIKRSEGGNPVGFEVGSTVYVGLSYSNKRAYVDLCASPDGSGVYVSFGRLDFVPL